MFHVILHFCLKDKPFKIKKKLQLNFILYSLYRGEKNSHLTLSYHNASPSPLPHPPKKNRKKSGRIENVSKN